MKLPTSFTGALEAAFNRYLQLDPGADERLRQLQGNVIGIELRGLDITLFIAIGDRAIHIHNEFDGQPDCTLRGTPIGLGRMGLGSRGGLFTGEVEIEGDSDVGQRFQALLGDVDIDWEEQLSRLSGDIAAHQLGRLTRSAIAWGKRSGAHLQEDVRDYLHEESRLLPHPEEVREFSADVDRLRDDVERLQARITRRHKARQPDDGETT